MSLFKPVIVLFLLFLLATPQVFAQSDSLRVIGKVTDKDNPYVWMPFMVVNKTTGKGVFTDNGGKFTISVLKSDTIMVTASGYLTQTFCFRDSSLQLITLNVQLEKKAIVLNPVDVKPDRDLEKIEEDIKKLKKEEVNSVTGINVAVSPLTALYERFGKIGRQKNLVAEMEYEDRRRELLKELFSKYVKYDIIDLREDEFDAFIDFLNLPDEFIKNSEQYDLIMAIKYRYEVFEVNGR